MLSSTGEDTVYRKPFGHCENTTTTQLERTSFTDLVLKTLLITVVGPHKPEQ